MKNATRIIAIVLVLLMALALIPMAAWATDGEHVHVYAEWYRDMSEEPKKYEGKTVRFKAKSLVRKRLPPNTFVIGRHVMTCCVEDIQFAALVCKWDKADTVRDEGWMILTAKINFRFSTAYGRKGPVLTYISHEDCDPPEQDQPRGLRSPRAGRRHLLLRDLQKPTR